MDGRILCLQEVVAGQYQHATVTTRLSLLAVIRDTKSFECAARYTDVDQLAAVWSRARSSTRSATTRTITAATRMCSTSPIESVVVAASVSSDYLIQTSSESLRVMRTRASTWRLATRVKQVGIRLWGNITYPHIQALYILP